MNIAIVYMVAGLSSRFGGKIKQLVKVGPQGESLIEYSLKQALSAGFNKIIFIVGDKIEKKFKEIFGDNYQGIPVLYAYQRFNPKLRDKPWGSNDAICSIKEIINYPFVICNGDDIYGEQAFKILFNHLKENNTCATIGYKLGKVLPEQGEVNRGIFKINPDQTVKSIKERFNISKNNLKSKNLTKESLCSMNMLGFQPKVLELLNKKLIKFKEKHQGDRKIECLLPEEISKLIQEGKISMKLYSTNEQWIGITHPEDENKVKEILKNSIINPKTIH
jgi:dTDP-glucose pyrophosphorylase